VCERQEKGPLAAVNGPTGNVRWADGRIGHVLHAKGAMDGGGHACQLDMLDPPTSPARTDKESGESRPTASGGADDRAT